MAENASEIVYITGARAKPEEIPWKPSLTLRDALLMSQKPVGSVAGIIIVREGKTIFKSKLGPDMQQMQMSLFAGDEIRYIANREKYESEQ
jgi:hypothetical protein